MAVRPKAWKSLLLFLTSQQEYEEQQPTSASPTTALRSERKTCGLFDTGVTSVTDGDTLETTTTASTMDHINKQHTAQPPVPDLIASLIASDQDRSAVCDDNAPVGVVRMDSAEMDNAFYEVFTDLRDFLLEENSNSTSTVVAEGTRPRKRTATEAILDAIENGENTHEAEASAPASPVDHNDYTLKPKKRSRLAAASTTSMSESDTESILSASVASTSSARGEKYVERRKKNNIASRRSRETRKQKFVGMEQEAERLERQNRELEAKVLELEEITKSMKAILVQKLAKK